MQPLIDGDVILYEVGFAAETAWKGMKKETDPEYEGPFIPPWELVEEMLEGRIANICETVEVETRFTVEPPIFFFTGKTNFRTEIARRRKYKERLSNKPWHYRNIKAFIQGKYEWKQQEGLEADDLICIEATSNPDTIICTRDKDLRTCDGWQFGWELHKQPQFGPLKVEGLGHIEFNKKLSGYGKKFFYSQCLTGDTVDSVPGLPGCGPINAIKILAGAESEQELYERVLDAYEKKFPIEGYSRLLEQARLLHMVREFEDGKALMWSPPHYDKEDWIDVRTGEIEVRAKRG